MMRILCFLLLSVFTLSPLKAQTTVERLQPGTSAEGVTYCLPKTALRLTLLLEKTTYTPGRFSRYADRFLRIHDVVQEPIVSWCLVSTDLTAFGVADTSRFYSVKLKGKSVGSNIVLSEEGVLLAVNTDPVPVVSPTPFKPCPKQPADNPDRYLGAEILRAGSTTKMAELTAQQLFDLRESKNQLIMGEADNLPKDGEQLRLMLQHLDQENETLTALFTGTTVRDTVEQVLIVVPDKEVKCQVLFRLSQREGLVDSDDLSGAPYYLSIEDLHATPADLSMADGRKDGGFYVNVPGKVRVSLHQGREQLFTREVSTAQFGAIDLINGALFKKFTTTMTLNPTTGAVDKVYAEMPSK